MAHERTSLPEEFRPVDVARSVAKDSRPGRPLEAGIPNSSPPSTVGHDGLDYRSDLGSSVVSEFRYSQSLNINGIEQLSIDATNSNNPNIGINSSRNGTNMDSEERGDGSSSGKKVKFLCSYQGKIMPRPSDGMLRYVGGQTRIITIRKNLRFDELEQKMIQVYGHPVVIKYQLPDEDLDALVSVSCDEDIDNMMDEYEKLLERCSDRSAKLRVFLFEASEVDSFEISQYGDAPDSGQRYVEAVNGVVGGLANKESIASGSSNPNSDFSGIDVVDSLGLDQSELVATQTPSTFSPHQNLATYHNDAPTLVPPDPHASAYLVPMTVPAEKPIAGKIQQQQQGYDLRQPITTPSEFHVDPRREILRQADSVHSPNQLLPSTASLFSQEPFQGNTLSVSSHQFFPAAHMSMAPLNAPIPAAPVLMQTHENGLGNYPAESTAGIQKLVPLPTEPRYSAYQGTVAPCIPSAGYGWTQVPLSNHLVLSDGVVHQQVIMPESLQRVEDCHMCQTEMPHVHSDPIILERSENSTMSVPYVSSAYHTFRPDDVVRIQQTNKFMGQQSFINHHERDTLHDPIANVGTTEPFPNEIVKEVPIKNRQQENPVDPSVAHGQCRQLSGLVETVKVHAPEIFTNCQMFISPVEKIGEEDIKGSSSQQIAGQNMFLNDISASHNIDHSGPTETLTRVVLPGHESQLKALCTPTQSPFLGNPGLHLQSLVGGLQFDSLEAQSSNSAYGAARSAFDAANLPSSLTSNPDAANLPSSLSSSVDAAGLKESSNSLFSNQNPWNLQQDAHPPKPQETEDKNDRFYSHDHFGENQSLLRGGVPHLQDLETDSNVDSKTDIFSSSKGLEEHIKQELQNVAEGVAASVLQSSTPSYPEPPTKVDDYASNWNGEASRNDELKQQFTHFKDIRNRLLERLNLNDSGSLDHLQIIMDSDLEELRELGSGTFGTVYHGKWRGTDVAIKRINDRCFAGKPSEQERMIDDFWNEAQNLAGLHHPNVVAFYGVVLDSPGGSVATVTEYMVNGSLRNALQKNVRNLDRRKRLLIAMDIAFGMEYLHGKNIVHFDLKSDNLLVNLRDPHRPICKVGDLGLSKVKCQTLISGGVRGTLPWMAPELLNGISSLVSEKVDVFSFGILLWELFTGEEPYADLHYGAIIGGIVSNTLRPPIPDLCDMDWKLLMERCWSAEPSERPSFTEVVDELRSMATKLSF